MSPSALAIFPSIRSGTRALTILRNRVSSRTKKNEMKTMENRPTAKLVTNEVTELMTAVTLVTFVTSFSLSMRMSIRLKSGPKPGNRPMTQSLIRSSGFPAAVALFSTAASRTMFVTTGMACVTMKMSTPRIRKMVRMASSQLGAAFPLMVTFRSSRMTGCPMSDTTKAAMM